MKATTDRILTAIFCDDIRHELGNKMSFMGCYQSELFVPSTPVALAKLCVYASVLTPIARPFKSLTLRVVLDDQTELARLDLPPEGSPDSGQVPDETATRQSINAVMMFSPFFVERPTCLRVMADTEEGEIVGPRLLIKLAPEISGAQMQSAEAPEPAKIETAPKKTRKRKPASTA